MNPLGAAIHTPGLFSATILDYHSDMTFQRLFALVVCLLTAPLFFAAAPAPLSIPIPATVPTTRPAPAPRPATAPADFSKYIERWSTNPKTPNPLLAHKSYHSAAMNVDVGYHLYLPPGYEDPANKDRKYPVIYWLHGLNQSESSNWFPPAIIDGAMKTGHAPPMIWIFVSGGGRAFYVDSADGKILSETTIIKELIPHVDATYRTVSTREGRAIQGMSMGGWGALRLAMTYPELFSSVVAFAPSLRTPENIGVTYPDVVARMFGGDVARFWAVHPLKLARDKADQLRKMLPITVYVGNKDHLLAGSRDLHALLTELKIEHGYEEVEGADHNMTLLAKYAKDASLIFAARHFTPGK